MSMKLLSYDVIDALCRALLTFSSLSVCVEDGIEGGGSKFCSPHFGTGLVEVRAKEVCARRAIKIATTEISEGQVLGMHSSSTKAYKRSLL
jgi:hypothetical protein